MPRSHLELESIAKQAAAYLALRGTRAEDLLPLRGLGDCPGHPQPLVHYFEPPDDIAKTLLSLPLGLTQSCAALEMRYDPEGLSHWAFVPGTDGRVWLVLTKRVQAALN